MKNKSLEEFTGLIASKAPSPGGGGAGAAAAAIGIALGDMVGELTAGKSKYADVEDDIRALMERAQELRSLLLEEIQADADGFEPLSRAYKIPKDDPSRSEKLEEGYKLAVESPLEVFDYCCEALEIMEGFAEKGSPIVISDAACGAAICRGALQTAAVNVKVNTAMMEDRYYANLLNNHVEEGLEKYCALADNIFEKIYGRY